MEKKKNSLIYKYKLYLKLLQINIVFQDIASPSSLIAIRTPEERNFAEWSIKNLWYYFIPHT